jgi:hypothetical protein
MSWERAIDELGPDEDLRESAVVRVNDESPLI